MDLGDKEVDILYLLGITAQLVQDQMDLQEDYPLFNSFEDPDVLAELQDFVLTCNSIFSQLYRNAKDWLDESNTGWMQSLIAKLLKDTSTGTPLGFYASRCLSSLLQGLVTEHGWNNIRGESWLQKLDIIKPSTTNLLGAVAMFIGLQESLDTSKLVNSMCNRLISDVAGMKAESDKTLSSLVLLNATLSVYDDGDLPVAQNRLVFAVKQILSWSASLPETNHRLASEVCYALHRLLPAIKDVYGSYWETSLSLCISVWDTAGDLSNEIIPMVGMSLKLYTILRDLEDPNDDLVDSLYQLNYNITHGMVKLLKAPRLNRRRRRENVPLIYVDEQLSRQLAKIPLDHVKDIVSDFYPFIASDSRIVQSAAYDILHRALPENQQQISLDVLLEKRDAQLPEELLSLLLDAPTLNAFPDEELAEFPTTIRGYLLSWKLVYDSYSTASFKVRNDYSEVLKSENYIGPLLDFMFDVLGHSAGYPISPAKFDASKIRLYDMWEANDTETPEQSLHWLLINLYYLCLKYTPSLAKTWWMDCKSKQTRLAVESWTAKYFSPLVIQDTMDDVAKWAEEQEQTDGENELVVKVCDNLGPFSSHSRGQYTVPLASTQRGSLKLIQLLGIKEIKRSLRGLRGRRHDDANRHPTPNNLSLGRRQSRRCKPRCRLREEMAQLVDDHSRRHHVFRKLYLSLDIDLVELTDRRLEWLHNRRPDHLPQKRSRRPEGPKRVRHLLFHHILRQEDARQEVRDLQPLVPC